MERSSPKENAERRENQHRAKQSKRPKKEAKPSTRPVSLCLCGLRGLSPWCAVHWLATLRTVHGIVNIGGRLLTGVLADQAHTSGGTNVHYQMSLLCACGLHSEQSFRGAASRTNPTPRNRRGQARCAQQSSTPAPSFRQLAVDTDGTADGTGTIQRSHTRPPTWKLPPLPCTTPWQRRNQAQGGVWWGLFGGFRP